MKEEVLTSPMLWSCFLCYRCYARCPQQVNFTDVMRALRYLAIKSGYISPRILSKIEELDNLAQEVRKGKLQDTFEGRAQILEELKEEVESRGAKLLVVFIPSKLEIERLSDSLPYQEEISQLCR